MVWYTNIMIMGKEAGHRDGASGSGTDADEAAGNMTINNDNREGDDSGDATSTADTDVASRTPSAAKTNDGTSTSKSPSLSRRPAPSTAGRSSRPSLQRSVSLSLHMSLCDLRQSLHRQSSRSLMALKHQSSALLQIANESLPNTPSGWALLALSAVSAGLQHELKLQRELTAPPLAFCQSSGGGSVLNGRMDRIHEKLSVKRTANGDGQGKEGILSRRVTPSLFIGTRGLMSSAAAYAFPDGSSKRRTRREREVMRMGADGAVIVLDWEIPLPSSDGKGGSQQQHQQSTDDQTIYIKSPNSIDRPVVLLVHGMNNDSSFGYVRSMMRTATERGWIAVCMNLRGQDGEHKVKNSTPRGYNAGYTGDLRGVVQQIGRRLKRRESAEQSSGDVGEKEDEGGKYVGGPIFLLGYSLGANIVTKYLGEESLHGTLPRYVGGGAAMGNPLHIHSGTISFPWNVLLGAGVKRSFLSNFRSMRGHREPGFQRAMRKALLAPTIGKLDNAASPYLIRNDSHPPYTPRIGFKDGEEYWHESSSHRYVGHVSVPLLKIAARDDFLVFGQFARKLNRCLESPNVMVVKTRCGGHLGWQESPPPVEGNDGGKGGSSSSWSDAAVADFIEALLRVQEEDRRRRMEERGEAVPPMPPMPPMVLSKL